MWLMLHPPYSPDLAPCDYFYFPRVEIGVEDVASGGIKLKTAAYLGSTPKSDFKRCYDDWLLHPRKCIATQGEHFKGDKINL